MKGLRHLGRDGVYQGTSAFTDQAVRGHRVQLNAINCRSVCERQPSMHCRVRQGLPGASIVGLASGSPDYRPLLLPVRLSPRAPRRTCCRDDEQYLGTHVLANAITLICRCYARSVVPMCGRL